jgi:hypothetical protein
MVLDALKALKGQQSTGEFDIPKGNFPSVRYHPVLRFSRLEDNVYFVSWIIQVLKRLHPIMSTEERALSESICDDSRDALIRYRSRYGQVSYNFYRPEEWFPNGIFLHRFRTFQPTAFRGFSHSKDRASELKAMMLDQANGKGGKYLKRGPKAYRSSRIYNTWIGSKSLFVDMDLSVICNVLMFNAIYDLGKTEVDEASLTFLIKAFRKGEHLSEPWSISAWYPFASVILYGMADLLSTGYYPELEVIRSSVLKDLQQVNEKEKPIARLLRSSSLMKLGQRPIADSDIGSISGFLDFNKDFSFGVIPILHPFNGRLAQWMGSFPMFRLLYRCDAQMLAILIEHELLARSVKAQVEGK